MDASKHTPAVADFGSHSFPGPMNAYPTANVRFEGFYTFHFLIFRPYQVSISVFSESSSTFSDGLHDAEIFAIITVMNTFSFTKTIIAKQMVLLGIQFDAAEALNEHMRWNVDRGREVLTGRSVHDVCHVW